MIHNINFHRIVAVVSTLEKIQQPDHLRHPYWMRTIKLTDENGDELTLNLFGESAEMLSDGQAALKVSA